MVQYIPDSTAADALPSGDHVWADYVPCVALPASPPLCNSSAIWPVYGNTVSFMSRNLLRPMLVDDSCYIVCEAWSWCKGHILWHGIFPGGMYPSEEAMSRAALTALSLPVTSTWLGTEQNFSVLCRAGRILSHMSICATMACIENE